MNWIDAGALVVVLLAVLDGWSSGLAWAVMEAVVLLLAAVVARAFGVHAEPYVAKVAALPATDLPWVAHLATFALTACSLFGVLLLLHPAAKKWRFRQDRWWGAGVGLMNGFAASVLIFAMAIGATDPGWETLLRESRLLPVVDAVARGPVGALLPRHVPERAQRLRT